MYENIWTSETMIMSSNDYEKCEPKCNILIIFKDNPSLRKKWHACALVQRWCLIYVAKGWAKDLMVYSFKKSMIFLVWPRIPQDTVKKQQSKDLLNYKTKLWRKITNSNIRKLSNQKAPTEKFPHPQPQIIKSLHMPQIKNGFLIWPQLQQVELTLLKMQTPNTALW